MTVYRLKATAAWTKHCMYIKKATRMWATLGTGLARSEPQSQRVILSPSAHIVYLALSDPTGNPITDEELALIAAVAPTVTVTDLRLWGELRHLSPAALHRLMFGFSSVKELTLLRFNGNQLTDEHLRECVRRQIWRLHVPTEAVDAGSAAFSDEALLDFLYAPDHGMHKREAVVSAFNGSPQFVQKLVNRANLATDIGRVELVVQQLPLGSQQLGGLRLTQAHLTVSVDRIDLEVKHPPLGSQQLDSLQLTENRGISEHSEQLENGARVTLKFGRKPMSPRR
ncbi:hypothetical protein AAVH_25948 [Aphelenchoides avenae]|nr:hypothetical protein AAVH_25948 [Aphelenchus avenae]